MKNIFDFVEKLITIHYAFYANLQEGHYYGNWFKVCWNCDRTAVETIQKGSYYHL